MGGFEMLSSCQKMMCVRSLRLPLPGAGPPTLECLLQQNKFVSPFCRVLHFTGYQQFSSQRMAPNGRASRQDGCTHAYAWAVCATQRMSCVYVLANGRYRCANVARTENRLGCFLWLCRRGAARILIQWHRGAALAHVLTLAGGCLALSPNPVGAEAVLLSGVRTIDGATVLQRPCLEPAARKVDVAGLKLGAVRKASHVVASARADETARTFTTLQAMIPPKLSPQETSSQPCRNFLPRHQQK